MPHHRSRRHRSNALIYFAVVSIGTRRGLHARTPAQNALFLCCFQMHSIHARSHKSCLLYQSGDISCNILEPTLGLLQLSDLILGVEIHFDQLSQKSLSSVISIVSIAGPPFTINCLPMMRRLRCNLANYR